MQQSQPASPSSSVSNSSGAPANGSLTEEKKIEAASQQATPEEALKNTQKSVRPTEKLAEKQKSPGVTVKPAAEDQGYRPPTVPAPPEMVDPFGTGAPTGGRHPRRLGSGGGTIRTLPNGTQIITAPDGTRIVTMPDGTRRVLRPGERINRRKINP